MYWKRLKRSEKRFLSEEKEINKTKKGFFNVRRGRQFEREIIKE